jgi:hypothetical protein
MKFRKNSCNGRLGKTDEVMELVLANVSANAPKNGVIGIFQRHNPSGRTVALESTVPLTEMSTSCISWR